MDKILQAVRQQHIMAMLPIILLFLTCSCGRNSQSTEYSEHDTSNYVDMIAGYAINAPTKKYNMPAELQEISGISYWKDDLIVCVQDELGYLFFYDLKAEEVVGKQKFGKPDDYEGVAVRGDEVFVISSDGKLHRVRLMDEEAETTVYELPFTRKNDLEGLCFSADGAYLLVVPKGRGGIDGKKKKKTPVYRWSLETEQLEESAFIEIDSGDFDKVNEDADKDFMPSGIAIHPNTQSYFVLAHQGKKLVVLSPDQQLEEVALLDDEIYRQPEAITFLPNGDLLIGSEGRGKRGYILYFPYER
ncbi:esterase-like activity of phytase family protein [Limibacter armeniacum]|uniref:esterase-like activity of phytase family protein n=1 Tax=Limibacter armeniacum TaxID=466084 RepID=UPI002FE5B9E8